MSAITETKLTAANNAAIQQWTNRPCGALDGLDEYSLAYFEAVERDRYENYAPWMREVYRLQRVRRKESSWKSASARVPISYSLPRVGQTSPALTSLSAISNLPRGTSRCVVCTPIYSTLPRPRFHSRMTPSMWSTALVFCTAPTIQCAVFRSATASSSLAVELIVAMYYKYSFFHAYTIFVNGILRGKLRRLGYKGLMSLIESGADG